MKIINQWIIAKSINQFEKSSSFAKSDESFFRRHRRHSSSKSDLLISENDRLELPRTKNTSLKITNIFDRLNLEEKDLADKIEVAKQKNKTRENRTTRLIEEKQSIKLIESSDLDSINTIERKRIRKLTQKFAQIIWIEEEKSKISHFHAIHLADIWDRSDLEKVIEIKNFKKESDDVKLWSSISNVHEKRVTSNEKREIRRYINELSSESSNWRAMQRHSFAAKWQKTTQIEFDAINSKDIWEITDRSITVAERMKIIFLKWVFKYKSDEIDFLTKFKVRIVIRENLQMIDNEQDVYAVTLTSKTFRMLIIMIAAYKLKTRQLNAMNAFLNVTNDEKVFCHMLDDYRLSGKIYRIIRALYEQRKSLLLWSRTFIVKCLELRLILISEKSCLFIDENDIIMFFYVDDIIFAFRMNREQAIDNLIERLKTMFEFREMSEIKHFLRMRVIIQNNNKNSSKSINRIIYLIQNAYVDKLVKNYEIKMKKRITQTLLSSLFILIKYENDLNQKRLHEFRQKIESICYSVTMIRSDITKTISKLIEFLINLEFEHIQIVDHCIRYLHDIKFLVIKFDASSDEELIVFIHSNQKHVFEVTINAFFVNEKERRSIENYTFKLFDDLIDWAVKKQVTIFTFIIEIELLALLHDAKKFI